MRLGGANNMHPPSWEGQGRDGKDPKSFILSKMWDLLCPQYVMHHPVIEHESLNSKSPSNKMARASGGCK